MRLASVITLAILALDCVVTLELETRSACFLLKSKNFDLQFLKLLGDRLLDTRASCCKYYRVSSPARAEVRALQENQPINDRNTRPAQDPEMPGVCMPRVKETGTAWSRDHRGAVGRFTPPCAR